MQPDRSSPDPATSSDSATGGSPPPPPPPPHQQQPRVGTGTIRLVWWLLGLALVLRLAMAWGNYGFVAMDDYTGMLRLAVPAQRVTGPAEIIATTGIRSPEPTLILYGLAQFGLRLGLHDPVDQIRFVYGVLGLLSLAGVGMVWWMFRRIGRPDWGIHGVAWTGLHFLAVYLSTRVLIENMSMPFLTAAAALVVVYAHEGRRGLLLGSVLAITVAATLRFQSGIVVLAILTVPLVQRRWRDLGAALLLGLALFLITGWADDLLRGGFHTSLRSYLSYNLHESSSFGVTAWWAYLALLAAVAFPPFLIGRYRGFPGRDYVRLLWPLGLVVTVFVGFHSAIPHKEDRFMTPVVMAYLALLAPFTAWLTARRPLGWRSVGFVGINVALVAALAVVPAQNNVIGVVRYLGAHPGIHDLWSYRVSAEPYPTAYAAGPVARLHPVVGIPRDSMAAGGCRDAVAVRSDLLPSVSEQLAGWTEVATFAPGLPERMVIWINPRNNTRRNPVHLFVPPGCGNDGGVSPPREPSSLPR